MKRILIGLLAVWPIVAATVDCPQTQTLLNDLGPCQLDGVTYEGFGYRLFNVPEYGGNQTTVGLSIGRMTEDSLSHLFVLTGDLGNGLLTFRMTAGDRPLNQLVWGEGVYASWPHEPLPRPAPVTDDGRPLWREWVVLAGGTGEVGVRVYGPGEGSRAEFRLEYVDVSPAVITSVSQFASPMVLSSHAPEPGTWVLTAIALVIIGILAYKGV